MNEKGARGGEDIRAYQPPADATVRRTKPPSGYKAEGLGTVDWKSTVVGDLLGQDFLEAIGAESLAATPRARIADDFLDAIVRW